MKILSYISSHLPSGRRSIFSRFAAVLIAATLIANTAIILIWRINVYDIVNGMSLSHISDIIKNSNSKFETDMTNVVSSLKNFANEKSVQQFSESDPEALEALNSTFNTYYALLADKLNGIAVITPDNIYHIGNAYFPETLIGSDYISRITEANGQEIIFNHFQPVNNSGTKYYSVGIRINDSSVLIADIRVSLWSSCFGMSNMKGILRTVITDGNEILFSLDQNISDDAMQTLVDTAKTDGGFNNFFNIEMDGIQYTAMVRQMYRFQNWTNITFFPQEYVFRSYHRMLLLVPWLIGLILLVVLAFSSIYSIRLGNRFKKLTHAIESFDLSKTKDAETENAPKSESGKKPKDELSVIEQKFSALSNTLSEQVNAISRLEENEHIHEMQSLRAQINPHFTYNALNVIQTLADMQNAENISEITKSLSTLLRYSVTNIDRFVSLRDELLHVKNYVIIMQNKFLNPINLQIDVPDKLLDCMTLKMLFQPIVENSIRHGLRDTADDYIMIKAYESTCGLSVKITDNGHGISQEKLNEILDYSIEDNDHLGLRNLDRRIKLTFGEDYGLTVYSIKERYTSVLIDIPLMERKDGDNE